MRRADFCGIALRISIAYMSSSPRTSLATSLVFEAEILLNFEKALRFHYYFLLAILSSLVLWPR